MGDSKEYGCWNGCRDYSCISAHPDTRHRSLYLIRTALTTQMTTRAARAALSILTQSCYCSTVITGLKIYTHRPCCFYLSHPGWEAMVLPADSKARRTRPAGLNTIFWFVSGGFKTRYMDKTRRKGLWTFQKSSCMELITHCFPKGYMKFIRC